MLCITTEYNYVAAGVLNSYIFYTKCDNLLDKHRTLFI
jgi:hypothetical protein